MEGGVGYGTCRGGSVRTPFTWDLLQELSKVAGFADVRRGDEVTYVPEPLAFVSPAPR
jgi:hypothetical protein